MNNKTKNKKGQGALDYLLIIGGAVLVSIIVIGILLSSSSKNAEKVEEQTLGVTDLILPSVITNVACMSTGDALISWLPTANREDYAFQLTVNGIVCEGCDFDTLKHTDNPITVKDGCVNLPAILMITTKYKHMTSVSNDYILSPDSRKQVSAPVANFSEGTHNNDLNVTLTTSTDGAEIIYILDDDLLDCKSGDIYDNSGPISVGESLTLKAIACKEGLTPSPILTNRYRLKVADVEITITESGTTLNPGGISITTYKATLETDTNGATIRYTTENGADLNCIVGGDEVNNNTTITNISQGTKIIAIGCKPNYIASDVVSKTAGLNKVPGGDMNLVVRP